MLLLLIGLAACGAVDGGDDVVDAFGRDGDVGGYLRRPHGYVKRRWD